MATIKQMFELMDGVSPVLNVISRTVDKTIGKFDRAAKAASGMETAAEIGANGVRIGADRAASPMHMLGGLVDGLGQKMRSVGDGVFNKLRAGLSGVIGQFALATLRGSPTVSCALVILTREYRRA